MGHLLVFGLSGREGLGCGDEALMFGAALGLGPGGSVGSAAAWAAWADVPAGACLHPRGQILMYGRKLHGCTLQHGMACCRGGRPCHMVPYPPLALMSMQQCFHQNLLFCTCFPNPTTPPPALPGAAGTAARRRRRGGWDVHVCLQSVCIV